MNWWAVFHLKKRKKDLRKISVDVEKVKFYGKTRQEVELLLKNYKCEYENELLLFTLDKTWYGKRKVISLTFKENRVEEKYIKTEYGKLSIAQLYKNLSGHY